MSTIKRIVGLPVRIGGEQHTGWLPAGAARPLPTPARDVLIDIEIQFDGHGYLLCYQSRDGDVYGDTWHQTLTEAEEVAAECFRLTPSQWQEA